MGEPIFLFECSIGEFAMREIGHELIFLENEIELILIFTFVVIACLAALLVYRKIRYIERVKRIQARKKGFKKSKSRFDNELSKMI